MPSVWKSTNPEVLTWWADVEERFQRYGDECGKVEKETGRRISLRTGFGDESVMGLSRSYSEPLPPGWKFGWGKKDSGFMEPRYSPNKDHPKEACEAAQEVVKRLNDLRPKTRTECHDRFGTPTFQFFGLHAISPGFWMHDGVLWLTFGSHDYEPSMPDEIEADDEARPDMTKYFEPSRKSEFYGVREAAGIKEDDD